MNAQPKKPTTKGASSTSAKQSALKQDDQPTSPLGLHVPRFLLLRCAVLCMLVLVVQFWLQHHCSIDFWKALTGGIATTVFVSITKFLWEGLFGKDDQRWKQPLQKLIISLIQTPSLIGLALLLAIVGSTFSSVTVLADGEAGPTKIALISGTSIESGRSSEFTLADGQAVKRFLLPTNPFGRLLTLQVEGYQPLVFDLPAWKGTRIRLNHDLERVPTLLVRVPIKNMSVSNMGKIALYAIDAAGNDKKLAEAQLQNESAAAIFGRPLPIPSGFITRWGWETMASGGGEQGAARVLLKWQNDVVVENVPRITCGQTLEARLLSATGDLNASRRFTVSSEPIQDILMIAKEQ